MKFKSYLLKRQQKKKNRREDLSAKKADCPKGNEDIIIHYESEPRSICTKDDVFLDHSEEDAVQMREKCGSGFRQGRRMTQSLITGSLSAAERCSCRAGDQTRDIHQPQVSCMSVCRYGVNRPSSIQYQYTSSPTTNELFTYAQQLSPHVHYNSLPYCPVQPDHLIDDVQYNSLPSSLTQSCNIGSFQSTPPRPTTQHTPGYCHRSRIRTNPWLPLPRVIDERNGRHPNTLSKAEPRLSRFISEVEEIMREQFAEQNSATKCLSYSSESLASSCGTATEIPEKQLDESPMRSPSEGYKSACDSECCSADIDSYSSDCGDLSDSLSSLQTEDSMPALKCSPPTYKDFQVSQEETTPQMHSSMSHSMCQSMTMSTTSLRSEDLQQRVRKLCQSTTQLDEKIRLARLESSYIQVK